jgi:hypothetical protein
MSLFIGGLHDGERHRVERFPIGDLPKQWSMTKRQPLEYAPRYYMPAPVEICSRTDHYNLLEFHIDGHTYHVYRHYKLKPHEAFEMLLRGYTFKELE